MMYLCNIHLLHDERKSERSSARARASTRLYDSYVLEKECVVAHPHGRLVISNVRQRRVDDFARRKD